MAKPGPKPKPSALRVFEGDPGKLLGKRKGEPHPPSADTVPSPPGWLGESGTDKWHESAASLHATGLLTHVDVHNLALWCEAWDEFFEAKRVIDEEGFFAVSEKGGVYQHPAVGVKNRAIARIRQFGADFGMSPASRVGLNVDHGETKATDDLEAFKKAGG